MSVLPGATNTTIKNSIFNAVSTTVSNVGVQNDVVSILHSHSATAGLLDAKERFDAPKCDEGTRTAMILRMKKFVQDGNASSSPALYWLHGPAGVGKSALAQSLSLLLKTESDHAASFFFSRTSPGRSNGNQLVVTLAYQLAMTFPALQPFMLKVVRANPGIFTSSNAVQMRSLIVEPINKWRKKYNWSIRRWTDRINDTKPHPRLILVDGLDECNDHNVQTDLIFCIASAVRQLSTPLRFVITSRPELHILTMFELNPIFQGLSGVPVTKRNLGDDEDADEQITTFLLKEFAEIRRVHPVRDFLPQQWPHPDQIAHLVSKSSKGFIYPATVIRYIKMPHNRPDQCLERILGLSEIPTFDKPYEPLDFLYRYIFESVPEANKISVRNIFHFLVLPSTWEGVTRNPDTIEKHFGYPPGHVQHVLGDLLCLVELTTVTSNRHIKVLHASLPDFLLDKLRSGPLCIDVSDAHAATAATYLSLNWGKSLNAVPSHQNFAHFLDHMMKANMSNTLITNPVIGTNLLPRYKLVCSNADSLQIHILPLPPSLQDQQKLQNRLRCQANDVIAEMVAYLLVLVIRHGPLSYIKGEIATIQAYILDTYPWAASVYIIYEEIIPALITLFPDGISSIYQEHIRRIFACEVAPSQNELREAIFELHFLMMAPFYQSVVQWQLMHNMEKKLPRTEDRKQWIHGDPNYWANIVSGKNDSNIPPS